MVNSVKEENKIIIFCQAPADIPYVLSLYEKYKEEKLILVYVVNVENVFNFLKCLNLNLHSLVFIPYESMSIKNPLHIFKERRRVKFLKQMYFNEVVNSDVYFFSRFEDWLTSAFVKSLSKKNLINYLDHYDFSSELFEKRKITFKTIILKVVFYVLTGVIFKLEVLEKLPEFNYKIYNIERQVPELNSTVFHKYRCEIEKGAITNPSVLFFISPCEDSIYDNENHDSIQLQIIESFKKYNWTVFVKGHPRIGIPENVMHLVDVQIPSYIPAEFIEIKGVSMCLGIITSSISHFAKNTRISTYSLINLFQFKEAGLADKYKRYLSVLSDNKVKYFKDYSDFESVIKNKFK